LSHPAVSTVIPGMRKVRTVESSCSVSDLGALPDEVLAKMKKHAWVKDFHS
jgi:aryl-alcohol dehydrogenase-like predicted oxidoreductase